MTPLMTAEDAANYFQCSPRTIYEWAERGLLPSVKLGRLVRFREEDLEAYVAAKRGGKE
jgi:PTS system nitrogen regulatory IIA component